MMAKQCALGQVLGGDQSAFQALQQTIASGGTLSAEDTQNIITGLQCILKVQLQLAHTMNNGFLK